MVVLWRVVSVCVVVLSVAACCVAACCECVACCVGKREREREREREKHSPINRVTHKLRARTDPSLGSSLE